MAVVSPDNPPTCTYIHTVTTVALHASLSLRIPAHAHRPMHAYIAHSMPLGRIMISYHVLHGVKPHSNTEAKFFLLLSFQC